MGISVDAERKVGFRLDKGMVSAQDLHKVRHKANAWVLWITDEWLLLSILTIFFVLQNAGWYSQLYGEMQ